MIGLSLHQPCILLAQPEIQTAHKCPQANLSWRKGWSLQRDERWIVLTATEVKMQRAEQYAGDGCQQGNGGWLFSAKAHWGGKKPTNELINFFLNWAPPFRDVALLLRPFYLRLYWIRPTGSPAPQCHGLQDTAWTPPLALWKKCWGFQTTPLHCSLLLLTENTSANSTPKHGRMFTDCTQITRNGNWKKKCNAQFGSQGVKTRLSRHTLLRSKHTPQKMWFASCKCMDHIPSYQPMQAISKFFSKKLQVIATVSTPGKGQNCAMLPMTARVTLRITKRSRGHHRCMTAVAYGTLHFFPWLYWNGKMQTYLVVFWVQFFLFSPFYFSLQCPSQIYVERWI